MQTKDIKFTLENLEIGGSVKFMNAVSKMDSTSPEYRELIKFIKRNNTKSMILEEISNHLALFATGTLANIISTYLN